MKKTIRFAAGVAALAMTTAACGTSEVSEADAGTPASTPTSAGDECADVTAEEGPVSVTDDLGRTVELDQPAERVVVLEWQQVEDVLTLCLTPVGVADIEGYSTWVSAEELPEGVTDVGLRGEPNLDAVFSADPDLVITEVYAEDDPVLKKLEKYDVPVLATIGADASGPIEKMKDTFTTIAEATGRTERAEAVLEEFDTALAEGKEAMADADLPTTDFVYFDGWIDGGNVAIRPFGQGSLVGDLGEELGLTNVWSGEVDEFYGLGQTDIEGMTEVGDAYLLHTGTQDPSGDDVFAELAESRVWRQLPAVQDDRFLAFPEGIWTFGGPRSSMQVIDAYVDVLAG
ncbi:ABC transporter substrate-binding protein [Nocardioides flavus (ex Wang et al. 2016)]|uniref:ABC transporter substrate-binding protein n=1 Tax=Nocardioides flavus (ex Wang et al. 2016) TaxID=2058780 RepID=A0ABQ3HNV2_9ACTN|nr:iron-siderophore ABC transporter substrate-binding protein [Nocardioides flavus (ex Wang et al. 2016)]GHE19347.1 ABC transporter substrate-binding protein [Nocardioides flavus (ex Wang et al. 2016)]